MRMEDIISDGEEHDDRMKHLPTLWRDVVCALNGQEEHDGRI